MEKEWMEKFLTDGRFMEFCRMVDKMKGQGERISIPFETASLLFDAGVDFVKGDWSLDIVHHAVKSFLESPFTGIGFHECFISRLQDNRWE